MIRFELQDRVAVVTLHRPEKRNAFSGRMGHELGQAFARCDTDDDIRAVVLTGSPPAFCSGADMSEGEGTFGRVEDPSFSASPVSPAPWDVRKPVIAAVNGHAIGIGLTLALQCDIRLVAQDGKYGVVQVRRGVMPDGGSHWTLPRIAGFSNAAEVLLTGRMFDGREAKELGIASRCLPSEEVLPAALEIAHDIATNTAPLSAALTKRLLWEALSKTRDEVVQRETELHHHLMGKPDAIEGVMAFLEKRVPDWKLSVSADWPEG